jgi:hypothetical protein
MLLENISTSTFDDRIDSSFGDTLLNLAGFIGQFNHENGPARVRVKFASLIELAARLVDPSGIVRRETFSRHEILDMLANWVKSPFAVSDHFKPPVLFSLMVVPGRSRVYGRSEGIEYDLHASNREYPGTLPITT